MRLIDYFDRGVAQDPEGVFVRSSDDVYTYAEGGRLSHRISSSLRALGVEMTHPVGILSRNHPRVLLAMIGIWRAGAVWTPLNAADPLESTTKFMQDAQPRFLFYDSALEVDIESIKASVPSIVGAVCLDDDVAWEAFLVAGGQVEVDDWGDALGSPSHPVARGMTGGTTGQPKSIILTNQVFATLVETGVGCFPRADRPVNLACTPLTHAASGVALTMMAMGATVVTQARFDADAVLDGIETYRVTHLFVPPTAYYDLLERQRARPRDVSSLRLLLLAGAAVSPDRLAQGVEVFGPCIGQSWGQAEAPMFVTWLDPEVVSDAVRGNHQERLASCGRPTLQCSVSVMAEDGTHLGRGEVGELVVRSRLVTPGYENDPEATAQAHAHGWHHTGDVGRCDEDGFVYIVDRMKDMIITGGFNVFASEVEAAILSLPGVRECAVIGLPDERWGEAVAAVVVLAQDAVLTTEQIRAECRKLLGPVRTPKTVSLVDELPKTAVGKVDKKSLRGR